MEKQFDYRTPDADVEVDWLITNKCNFDCEYCYPQLRKIRQEPMPTRSIPDIIHAFDSTGKTFHAIVSGGEPFLFKDFVYLSQEFTKKHYLSIYTNFSTENNYDFLKSINPERVCNLFVSYHSSQRKTSDRSVFVKKCLIAQERSFNIHVVCVAYPPLLKRIEDDIAYLEKNGVTSVNIKVFKGSYKNLTYPISYTAEEREFFAKVGGKYPHTDSYLQDNRDFRGRLCMAGTKFFRIDHKGFITRCASDTTPHGNLFEGGFVINPEPKPCKSKHALTLTNCKSYLVP